jgi:activator of HSP90 ATPase
MEGRKPNNYHWTDCNISSWTKETIQRELESRGYKVKEIDVDARVYQRMNNLGMAYTVGFDTVKDGAFHSLKNFYSTSEPAEGIEDFSWFLDFFKELEARAILQFGGRVLDSTERETGGKVTELREVDAVDARYEVLRCTMYINCSIEEFKDFVTKREFIEAWTRGEARFENGEVIIGRAVMRELWTDAEEIKMKFRMQEWSEFSEVTMSLEKLMTDTRVMITQKKVPLNEAGGMELWWRERMVSAIASSFGFVAR